MADVRNVPASAAFLNLASAGTSIANLGLALPSLSEPQSFMPRLLEMERILGTARALLLGYAIASDVSDPAKLDHLSGVFDTVCKTLTRLYEDWEPKDRVVKTEDWINLRVWESGRERASDFYTIFSGLPKRWYPQGFISPVNCINSAAAFSIVMSGMGYAVGQARHPDILHPYAYYSVDGTERLTHSTGTLDSFELHDITDTDRMIFAHAFSFIATILTMRVTRKIEPVMFKGIPFLKEDIRRMIDWLNIAESINPFHSDIYSCRSYLLGELEDFAPAIKDDKWGNALAVYKDGFKKPIK